MLELLTGVLPGPDPMPLDVRVALRGSLIIYYLLMLCDEDFAELFMVSALYASAGTLWLL